MAPARRRTPRPVLGLAALAAGLGIACGALTWEGIYTLVAGTVTTTLQITGQPTNVTVDYYGQIDSSTGCEVFVADCAGKIKNGPQELTATDCPVQQNPPGCAPGSPSTITITGIVDQEVGGVVMSIDVSDDGLILVPVQVDRTTSCAEDSDGDRLDDCVETNTGTYVDPLDTGTDPFDPDTDGDGIDDGDEVLGTLGGLDLPGMGTNPLVKNILLEYDWFDDSNDCAAHSHRPTVTSMNMVRDAFAAAPVANPDGSTGIVVIQDRGQGGLFTGGNLIVDPDGVLSGGVNGSEFKNYKTANFDPAREGYFHYTILPHRYNTDSGSSGQAELPGDDMIVSLYCANSNKNVAHTIMHELGHNLLLRHGGDQNCNYKPNYNSVMNYKYQFPGVDDDCTPPGNNVLDYSWGTRIDPRRERPRREPGDLRDRGLGLGRRYGHRDGSRLRHQLLGQLGLRR